MTSTIETARVQFAEGEVVTPPLRRTVARLLYWIVLALILVIFAVISLLLVGSSQSKARLSATNPSNSGAQALVTVLRRDGIVVTTPRTLAAAERDATAHALSTTLVIYDETSILKGAQFAGLTGVASNVVLIEPDDVALEQLAPGVLHAGVVAATAQADCTFEPVVRAGSVSGLAVGYRLEPGSIDETGCLGRGGVYSLARVNNPNQTVTVLGATTPLTNGAILRRGNGALAIGLFGQTKYLVWYLPSAADANVPQDGVLPIPPWVTLTIVLAGLVLVAAGVWRGRRFGPVVVERMPVFVRSSETLEGRARLYQKSSARVHALDSLRIGAIGRMAIVCGLPSRATIDEVIGGIARATGRSAAELRTLLVDKLPSTDMELLRLSDGLAELEAEVTRSVRPE